MNLKDDLIDLIKKNETRSRSLDIAPTDRKVLLEKVNAYTEEFLTNLGILKAYEGKGYDKFKEDQFFEIREDTLRVDQILSLLKTRIDQVGLNPASPGHLGYIPGGGIFEAAVGDYIAAVTNRYAGVFFASPGAVRMENALIDWAGRLMGYKNNFAGNLTSGGSIANLIAISTARHAKDITSKLVAQSVIYTTQQSHHSIQKAIKICGLEECTIRFVDLDENYRLTPEVLEKQIIEDQKQGLHPFLIIANAGSTDTGAIDPIQQIAVIANKYDLWLHLDAAYGGFFMLSEYGKQKMKGIELADSIILDPHKGMFIPYGSGIILVKNKKYLLEANNYEANYMQDIKDHQEEYSPSELSPELSKHFRGMRLWLPLKLHGIDVFRACLEEKLGLAAYFNRMVKKTRV